jgi:hypothetical protein
MLMQTHNKPTFYGHGVIFGAIFKIEIGLAGENSHS